MGAAPVGTIDALNRDFPLGYPGFTPIFTPPARAGNTGNFYGLLRTVFLKRKPCPTDQNIRLIRSIHVN